MNAPGPLDVVFTQYLRPDGRQKKVWITRSAEIVALANRLIGAGYHFDIEELRDHTVSMTCEPNTTTDDEDDAPIAIELVPNGPDVLEAVDRLIRAAAAHAGVAS